MVVARYEGEPQPARVVARHVFYNNGPLDGADAASSDADDRAIDATKQPLLPGRPASRANITATTGGINGVIAPSPRW